METFTNKSIVLNCLVFKSYYVVWKRYSNVGETQESTEFKSYYVVWKQARGDDIFQGNIWFKSYYVVWKLFECNCFETGRYYV